jgi:hypothetical protein
MRKAPRLTAGAAEVDVPLGACTSKTGAGFALEISQQCMAEDGAMLFTDRPVFSVVGH